MEPGVNPHIQEYQKQSIQQENEELYDRERRMKKIEVDVVDINLIMSEISTLISEQGVKIESIEGNISNVADNVEEGHNELIKAENYQQKYRKKVLFILLLCIIVAIIITLSTVLK